MRILLLFPRNPYPKSPLAFGFPVGLGYLGAMLEKEGHTVNIYDACFENHTLKDVCRRILDFNPDIVAMTIYTAFSKMAVQISRLAKMLNPEVITVAGGSHADSRQMHRMRRV